MGSTSLDVSADAIREKMKKFGQPPTYSVVGMHSKDSEGKHNQSSISLKNTSKPSLKKQKNDKRKRI
jgi:hypothetical protein